MIKLEKGDIVTMGSNDSLVVSISYDPVYDGENVIYAKNYPNIRVIRRGEILIDNIKDVNED